MKKSVHTYLAVVVLVLLCNINISYAQEYGATVKTWESYKDVSQWMKSNWDFDDYLAKRTVQIIKRQGPDAATVKSAEDTFNSPRGWCKDAAEFSKDSLNLVDSNYKAEYIFINNKVGSAPNHWVTGFRSNGKIYVMDYGAGSHWTAMMGTHGPYDSLDEYRDFLANLNMKNFEVDFVVWASAKKGAKSPKSRIRAKKVLQKFDRNGDDVISIAEAPLKMKKNFKRLDKNGDAGLDEQELTYLAPGN